MAYQVACPSCGTSLDIPEGLKGAQLTCPHCLAQVPNPGVGILTATPVGPSVPTATPEVSTPRDKCVRCGETVQNAYTPEERKEMEA